MVGWNDTKRGQSVTVRYAVTFEFEARAPVTHRGTVVASSAATCGARAMREAQRALRPVNWSSVVCVLLERLPEADTRPTAVLAAP